MLIPCIDLQGGQAVQLVHGRRRELAVADVFGLLDKFRNYPWLHIIDLDAAMGKPANDELAHDLCVKASAKYKMKVRVGGGIRTVARAATTAKWGAVQIIIGSAAFRSGKANVRFLSQLVKENRSTPNRGGTRYRKRPHRNQRLAPEVKASSRNRDGTTPTVLRRIPLYRRGPRRHNERREPRMV